MHLLLAKRLWLGITIGCVITDNGSAFRIAFSTLGIRQKFTRAYRPYHEIGCHPQVLGYRVTETAS